MTANNKMSKQNWDDDQHTLYLAKQSSVGGSNKQTSASHAVLLVSSSNTKNICRWFQQAIIIRRWKRLKVTHANNVGG